MLVLGIIDSKPSTVAIVEDGRILAAVAEERLNRKKQATGVPRRALLEALAVSGASAKDIDRVAIAQRVSVFQPHPQAWPGWFESDISARQSHFDRLGSALAPVVGDCGCRLCCVTSFSSAHRRLSTSITIVTQRARTTPAAWKMHW
jgi:hypothetical protein